MGTIKIIHGPHIVHTDSSGNKMFGITVEDPNKKPTRWDILALNIMTMDPDYAARMFENMTPSGWEHLQAQIEQLTDNQHHSYP